MASSNILIFDVNKGNMSSDNEYSSDAQRLNGVQTGIASSKLQNKTLYQTTLVAYAIGQLMVANSKNANDSDAVNTFASNLSDSILQPKDFATASEASTGTATNKIMSPKNVADVISGKFATQAEANAGSITNKYMSPSTDYAAITNRMATDAEVTTGTSTVKIVNPARLAAAFTSKFATQAEAEAATVTTKYVSPKTSRDGVLKIRSTDAQAQALSSTDVLITPANLNALFATQTQVDAGSILTRYISPGTLYTGITNRMATNSEVDTGTNTTKIVNPATLARRIGTREPNKSKLTISLAAANWSSNTITVTATGVTASNTVEVSPAPGSFDVYSKSRVYCYSQAANSLTFKCFTTPSSNLSVNVIIWS